MAAKMSESEKNVPTDGTSAYEKRDTNTPKIFGMAVGGVILIAFILFELNQFFVLSQEVVVYEQVLALQSREIWELRVHDAEILGSYAVIDAEAGVYRIPIERSMELMADEAYANNSLARTRRSFMSSSSTK